MGPDERSNEGCAIYRRACPAAGIGGATPKLAADLGATSRGAEPGKFGGMDARCLGGPNNLFGFQFGVHISIT